MKKYLVMMLCAGMLFAATGCGDEKKEEKKDSDTKQTETTKDNEKEKSQVLKCSSSIEDIMDMDVLVTYDKDGKTIQSMSYVMKVDVEDELEELEELTKEEIANEICGEVDFDSVKSCDAKLNGNKVVANIEFDVDKITEDSDEFEFNKNTAIEDLKEILADDDYTTCEIEK